MFNSRLVLLVCALFTAGLVSAPPSAGADPVSSATITTPDPTRIRVGSYNIRAGVGISSFKRAVASVKPEMDVVGLQEIGSTERHDHLRSDPHWGYYHPSQLRQNPIIWNRSIFDLREARGYRIAEKRDLGGEHTGDPDKGDSWATIVRLRHRPSGQLLSFVNVHLVRGAVKGGRPVRDLPKLVKLYTDQLSGTIRAVKEERARADKVYVLGDFNAGYKADQKWRHPKLPFRRFKEIGYRSMWMKSGYLREAFGTRNDALIDQVWTPENSVEERILRSIDASDHWPAVATYRLPEAPLGYQPEMGSIGFGDVQMTLNGTRPGDTENSGPSKIPSIFVPIQGDPRYGYAQVRVVEESAMLSLDGNAPGDFSVDTSTLYDHDVTNNVVTVDLVADDTCEPDETFTLELTDPVNTEILAGSANVRITIKDDDC